VLQAAVTGELTREWRESHQGEIDELHFDTNKNSMYLEKIVNPYGWGVFKFEELITKSQNGLSKRNSELGDDVIVLRLADITSDMVNTEKKRYIKCSKQEIDNYELHKDDLLCIRVNGSRDLVGRVIRISELPETMLFCDHFIRFKLKNDNMAKYLSLYLNSDLIRKYIEKNMVSSAGQNTVSQGTYFNIMVTLPSIQEQYKILEYIEQAFSIISNLDKTIEINLKKISHTRQSILSQAFTGNLIPRELEL
jgi:type I restriction enzyme S subunit